MIKKPHRYFLTLYNLNDFSFSQDFYTKKKDTNITQENMMIEENKKNGNNTKLVPHMACFQIQLNFLNLKCTNIKTFSN